MFYLLWIVVGYLSFFFGTIAFAQIIGGIRTKTHFFAVALWSVLTITLTAVVWAFLHKYLYAYLIGLSISFLIIFAQKNIE